MNKILNVLILLITSCLVGCSTFKPTLDIFKKPPLNAEVNYPIELDDVEWIVVTEKNVEEVIAKNKDKKGQVFLVALDEKGYKTLAINNAKVLKYIKRQKAILNAYKIYYETQKQ